MRKILICICIAGIFINCESNIIEEEGISEITIIDNKKFDTIKIRDLKKIDELIELLNESDKQDAKFANRFSIYLGSFDKKNYISINGKYFRYQNESYLAKKDIANFILNK